MDPTEPLTGQPAPASIPVPPTKVPGAASTSKMSRWIVVAAIIVLSGYILSHAPQLWAEIRALRLELEGSRRAQPMGYVNISPNPSYATPPKPWHQEEDDGLLLWAGWKNGLGHTWFRIGRGELDLDQLHQPFGRDVVRAIDKTIVEVGSGPIWGLMHHETQVVGLDFDENGTAYPMLLLEKVEVVNDTIGSRSLAVVFTPFVPAEEAVDIYDPVVDGKRLTFGSSGYLQGADRRPLLYDRETESLWVMQDHALQCQAGPRRGTNLTLVRRGVPVPWSHWAPRHGRGRLIVGADRDQPDRPSVRAAAGGSTRPQAPLTGL